MQRRDWLRLAGGIAAGALATGYFAGAAPRRNTVVAIRDDEFWINGQPTYPGRIWEGHKIQGLLMNSRMIQGIFDDRNPETVSRWAYPDTGKWDADRNTREFIEAMPVWLEHGLLGFVVGMQGGSPQGYSREQPWENNPFEANGSLREDYMGRLKRILDRSDELGMVSIVNVFYFGQDERLDGDSGVLQALDLTVEWILDHGYTNVVLDVVNEANVRAYQQPLMKTDRVHDLVMRAREKSGGRLLVSTSYGGGYIPPSATIQASDFVLVHGNGVKEPERITRMVSQVRLDPAYRPMPILFNEDDHFDFEKPVNNMLNAVRQYAGWGYFDPGESNYKDGYQCPPVNWGISSDRKRSFFARLKEVTGV
jgi:hypothetical protein